MVRYPHRIIVQAPSSDANNPYSESTYETMYEGKCRCFLNGQSRFRTQKVMDADFCVSIPDPKMNDVGENYRVAVKYPQNPSDNAYNLVGFVKDFVRYDKVCYIFFQVMKENMVEEDMPED